MISLKDMCIQSGAVKKSKATVQKKTESVKIDSNNISLTKDILDTDDKINLDGILKKFNEDKKTTLYRKKKTFILDFKKYLDETYGAYKG